MSTNLKKIVRNHIDDFLSTNTKMFFNERDFQVNLANYLKNTKFYDNVFLEYTLPLGTVSNYNCDIRVDIVLEKDKMYFPIELKYKTKMIKGETLIRFGKPVNNIGILTNQQAQNIGRYSFWKDVERLEAIKKTFASVDTGFCVFLTNDSYYKKSPQGASATFTIEENSIHTGIRDWGKAVSIASDYPPFTLKGNYKVKKWDSQKYQNVDFYYNIVEVSENYLL